MPTDGLDLPFQRPNVTATTAISAPQTSFPLNAENILLAEFGHASVVAYQSQEERTALLDHYLVLAGIVATACGIAATYAFEAHVVGPLLAVDVALPIFTLISFGFFTRLMHLGLKHQEALVAMNMIKDYYLRQLHQEMPHLHQAFRWRASRHHRRRSSGTTFFTATIIAITSSFALAIATELLYYYTRDFGGAVTPALFLGPIRIGGLVVDGPVFLVALASFGLYYRRARQTIDAAPPLEPTLGLGLPGAQLPDNES
jgi:hypothetical protein